MSQNDKPWFRRAVIAQYAATPIDELHRQMLIEIESGGEAEDGEQAMRHRAEANIIDAIGAYMYGGEWHMLKQIEGTA